MKVAAGVDVLEQEGFKLLSGKRLGLVCNHTAINLRRRHLLELALEHGLNVQALFAPEHGFQGRLDEPVASSIHEPTGLPIYSLYGPQQKPAAEMLAGLEALVYDIADVGVRFYTYTTTMTHCLAAAAEAGLEFFVLDRPNPNRGDCLEGPILDEPFSRLSAWHPLPLRHGLTSGELARWANEAYKLHATLHVIPCVGWRRHMWLHDTGLPWINPSPNIRNPRQALLYIAIGTLEACNISVGRGTHTPFEVIGAPWMDELVATEALQEANISGLAFAPLVFVPEEREFAGQECHGVFINLYDWQAFSPVRAAVQIALVLHRLWPEHFGAARMRPLLGSAKATEAIIQLKPVEEIEALWADELQAFCQHIKAFWLYN